MSETGNNSCDNKPQQEDVSLEESPAKENEAATAPASAIPEVVENKPVTPVKRTPTKRLSAVERAQRESEELVKTLGGSLDIEGGRKTRSSTRGTPSRTNAVNTPPPTKRARGTGTPKRGRGRKLETAIEDETKISPEKTSIDLESSNNEKTTEVSNVDATKPEEKSEDNKNDTTATSSEVIDEKSSPIKEDDKPEPMEVDGSNICNNSGEESGKAEESTQNKSETSSITEGDASEKSNKVVDETIESSKATDSVVTDEPPVSTEKDKNISLVSENIKPASDEQSAHENNVEGSTDATTNSNSLPEEGSLSTEKLPSPVSAASNESKTENNELCEPKIASPPITASNEGATPQYCN